VARIGAAIAYFISRRGAQLIVIERREAAGAASGKSGGFLALDWCGGIRTRALMAGRTRIDLRLRVLWPHEQRCRIDPGCVLNSCGGPAGNISSRAPSRPPLRAMSYRLLGEYSEV
jgi:glycine/D-amino acid oxidase-like deaminating enzyme